MTTETHHNGQFDFVFYKEENTITGKRSVNVKITNNSMKNKNMIEYDFIIFNNQLYFCCYVVDVYSKKISIQLINTESFEKKFCAFDYNKIDFDVKNNVSFCVVGKCIEINIGNICCGVKNDALIYDIIEGPIRSSMHIKFDTYPQFYEREYCNGDVKLVNFGAKNIALKFLNQYFQVKYDDIFCWYGKWISIKNKKMYMIKAFEIN